MSKTDRWLSKREKWYTSQPYLYSSSHLEKYATEEEDPRNEGDSGSLNAGVAVDVSQRGENARLCNLHIQPTREMRCREDHALPVSVWTDCVHQGVSIVWPEERSTIGNACRVISKWWDKVTSSTNTQHARMRLRQNACLTTKWRERGAGVHMAPTR